MAAEARDPRRPDNIDVEVGRLVRVQRIARGLSQTELGNQIGVTFQQVQKYESGANRRAAPSAPVNPKDQAKYSEAVGMLGKIGALRLLKAFNAIPKKPAGLRESIVHMVEGASAAARAPSAKRGRRRTQ